MNKVLNLSKIRPTPMSANVGEQEVTRRSNSPRGNRRSRSPSPAREQVNEEEFIADLQQNVQKVSKYGSPIRFVLPALITSLCCIILYATVGGIDLKDRSHLMYSVIAYIIGVALLFYAYDMVNKWILRQGKSKSFGEAFWFSVFYCNAFYIFLVMACGSFGFSSFTPAQSIILTQLTATVIPALILNIKRSKK